MWSGVRTGVPTLPTPGTRAKALAQRLELSRGQRVAGADVDVLGIARAPGQHGGDLVGGPRGGGRRPVGEVVVHPRPDGHGGQRDEDHGGGERGATGAAGDAGSQAGGRAVGALAHPALGRPEHRSPGDGGERGHQRHAREQHHQDGDRDRRSEDAELAEAREAERRERRDDGQRGRGDDGADALRGVGRGGATVLAGAQALAQPEQQEQEVVDADADQHDGDQLRRADIEREAEGQRGQHNQAARGAGDEVNRQQRDERGGRAAEEQQAEQDDGAEQQRLLDRMGAGGGLHVVGLRGDAAGEPDAQAALTSLVGGPVADLTEVVLGDGIGRLGLPLQPDELEAPVTRERPGLRGDDAPGAPAEIAGLALHRGAVGVGPPARHRRRERADRVAIGGGQRLAVAALDQRGDGPDVLLLPEGGLGVLGGLGRLGALGQEPGGVVGRDLVAEQARDEGQPERDGQPHDDDPLRAAGRETDDGAEHLM
jgi:hypothetical protein